MRTYRPHWYYKYIGECPVCGRDMSYRERRYGTKPDVSDVEYWHELNKILFEYIPYAETYCGCLY